VESLLSSLSRIIKVMPAYKHLFVDQLHDFQNPSILSGDQRARIALKRNAALDKLRTREPDFSTSHPLLNGDLMPDLWQWKDSNNFDYAALMTKSVPLRYSELAKLTPFLLGNGVRPQAMQDFFFERKLIAEQKDWKTIQHWIRKFEQEPATVFYYDLEHRMWLYGNGTQRVPNTRPRE